tara:strand:- start:468 stop:1127 length:660 start_codon:yes stop_codon:yes gene_type:complete
MKKIIATIVAFVFSTSAYAVELSSLSVGATLNHGLYGADGKEENFDHLGALGKTTKKDGAAFVDSYATLFLELALTDAVSLGVSYAPDAISTPKNINDDEGGTDDITVEADFNDLTTVYLLAKSPIGIYGKLGFSQMEIDVKSTNAGTYKDPGTTDGHEIAIGYMHEIDGGVSVRVELAYHEFEDVKADNGKSSNVDANKITITNMEGATGRISLAKSF